MRYKQNWNEAKERFSALWEGRYIDRPCMTVTAPRSTGRQVRQPSSPIEKWLDPEYVVDMAVARMESTYWAGEAIPSVLLLGGWVVCHGAKPQFGWDTIWHEPIAIDWANPPTFPMDWEDPWLRRYQSVYQAVLQAAQFDDFLMGRPCLIPGNDLLALIMGGNEFLTNLVDRPDWMREAILTIGRNQVEIIKWFAQTVRESHAFWYGNSEWMTFWAPEEYISTQADVSCMLSPEMFDEFILPELNLFGQEFGRMWYHLDGARALQHLPRLLSLPYMRVIQFIPEPDMPPNGSAWLDLYQKIQSAGKIVHITVEPQYIEEIVRQLDPGLLCIDAYCGSTTEADELLEAAVRWTRS